MSGSAGSTDIDDVLFGPDTEPDYMYLRLIDAGTPDVLSLLQTISVVIITASCLIPWWWHRLSFFYSVELPLLLCIERLSSEAITLFWN